MSDHLPAPNRNGPKPAAKQRAGKRQNTPFACQASLLPGPGLDRRDLLQPILRRKPSVAHPSFRARRTSDNGFTLIEVSTILAVLVILSAMLLPQVRGFVQSAQKTRARGDLQAIANSFFLFFRDVGSEVFRECSHPQGETGTQEYVLRLLVSSGDIPELGAGGDVRWGQGVNGLNVDFLDNYLVTNSPGGDMSRRLPTPLERTIGPAWRGSYVSSPIQPDPWGNRYMINTQFLYPGGVEDVVVYCAGPDEKVETEFARDGLIPGWDDLIFLFARDGGGYLGSQAK